MNQGDGKQVGHHQVNHPSLTNKTKSKTKMTNKLLLG